MFRNDRDSASRWVVYAAAAVTLMALPSAAHAGDWSFFLGLHDYPRYVRTVQAEPVAEWRTRRVWVEPEYVDRTVEVTVPAVVATRRVAVHDGCGVVVGYRLIETVIEPSHVELRTERVKVRDGYYKTIRERVVVTPAVETVVETRVTGPSLHLGLEFGHHRRDKHHQSRAVRLHGRDHHHHYRRAAIRASVRR